MTGFNDSVTKLDLKDEELRLADRIFVASKFTAKTLADYPGPSLPPIEIIPYGFPPINVIDRVYDTDLYKRPLKLLFVGKLTQQKGVADLFAAVEAIGIDVELTLVGHKASEKCPALDAALSRHKWIPTLPHEAVLNLMRENDVLVFPSLFDGFGLVISEAMAQGTPVISTDRCAGPDLIEHGRNGWLIEANSTSAIKSAIENILNYPENISRVGRAALETARRRPWEVYSYELHEAIKRHFNNIQVGSI
jgi:glycosyltransferase involved in cell wall biosynthesis